MKQKYACKYGATSTRKCLVPFSGNGKYTCRLYEMGQCNFDRHGRKIEISENDAEENNQMFEKQIRR